MHRTRNIWPKTQMTNIEFNYSFIHINSSSTTIISTHRFKFGWMVSHTHTYPHSHTYLNQLYVIYHHRRFWGNNLQFATLQTVFRSCCLTSYSVACIGFQTIHYLHKNYSDCQTSISFCLFSSSFLFLLENEAFEVFYKLEMFVNTSAKVLDQEWKKCRMKHLILKFHLRKWHFTNCATVFRVNSVNFWTDIKWKKNHEINSNT